MLLQWLLCLGEDALGLVERLSVEICSGHYSGREESFTCRVELQR